MDNDPAGVVNCLISDSDPAGVVRSLMPLRQWADSWISKFEWSSDPSLDRDVQRTFDQIASLEARITPDQMRQAFPVKSERM